MIFVMLLTGFAANNLSAQDKMQEVKIYTSAVCEMCKTTLEKALAFEKGVKQSSLDVKSKVITVVYNPEKTSPEKIRAAIAKTGYDADNVPANPKAYKKLEGCCKKKGAVCNDK